VGSVSSNHGDFEEKVFEALSHRIRRGIVKTLGEKGKRSFTELMKDLNIDDTGTLTFHLKKLAGFITKTPDGYYELTELGLKAYSLLKSFSKQGVELGRAGGKEAELSFTVVGAGAGSVKPDLVILSDRLSLRVDRELLEKVRSMGKRLLIADVVRVEVDEDVDPRLFEEAVEGIQDVVTLRVPKHLETLAQLKARSVLSIGTSSGKKSLAMPFASMIAGAVEAMASTVARVLTSLTPRLTTKPSESREHMYSMAIESAKALKLSVEGGFARVSQGDVGRVEVYRRDSCDFDVLIGESGEVKVDLSGCEAYITLPKTRLDKLSADVSGGIVELEIATGVKNASLDVEGGAVKLNISELQDSNISIDVSGGVVEAKLNYSAFTGESRITTEMSGGVMKIDVEVHKNTTVNVIQKGVGGYTDIDIDEELKLVKQGERVLNTELEINGGYAKASFKAKK